MSATVGVVLPVLNGAQSLAAAIRSVCDQEPAPDDVLVIDGGSDDGSLELAQAIPGVRVIVQSRSGLGAARNEGVRAVTGDLIAFCDSDDRWKPGALASRLDHLSANAPCGAVIGHVEIAAFDGLASTPQQCARIGTVSQGYTPGALMMRRSTFDAVGDFDEGLAIGTDGDWFVRLTQSDVPLDVLPDLVLQKWVHASSLSTDVSSYRQDLLEVARRFIQRRRKA